jgi:hypothetical protein
MEQQLISIQKVKVNDLFYTLWGYDQTNYDYVIVKSISPTGKTAYCKIAQCEHIASHEQSNEQKPIKKGVGGLFRLKIEYDNEGKPRLRGSYPFCFAEVMQKQNIKDCSFRLDTFWYAEENQTFLETDTQFGH